jgi:prepilin-type N-terminal cleavage/methylation domain-containing protein
MSIDALSGRRFGVEDMNNQASEANRIHVHRIHVHRIHAHRTQRISSGFTLVELLIGMAILGVILVAAGSLLQGNQKVTADTQTRSNALGDARGALSRMTESFNQASYIFPMGVTIKFSSDGQAKSILTGPEAVAALIAQSGTYEGVIYYLADRSEPKFADDLPQIPADRIAQKVLVEARTQASGVTQLDWPARTIPFDLGSKTATWNREVLEGVLVDGIYTDATVDNPTHLMSSGILAPIAGSDGKVFLTEAEIPDPPVGGSKLENNQALITSVAFQIGIRIATGGKSLSESGTTALRGLANARNVPRH